MNLLTLFSNFLILLWMPALLHSTGMSPSQAILGTTMYALGTILGALVAASMVDRLGVEPVLTLVLAFGASCVLATGLLGPPFWLLLVIVCGAGLGIGGCQTGINALSGRIYPPFIRSTGAGWALAAGRVGTIVGPLLGGVLLALGFRAQDIFVAAALPILSVTVLMAMLGQLRRSW